MKANICQIIIKISIIYQKMIKKKIKKFKLHSVISLNTCNWAIQISKTTTPASKMLNEIIQLAQKYVQKDSAFDLTWDRARDNLKNASIVFFSFCLRVLSSRIDFIIVVSMNTLGNISDKKDAGFGFSSRKRA
ncbi:hypothetical protein BpHYR1_009625 [Brachionus plicatilis]|uniref:Uncharacterized protein n=1 Tax=Brachionus plicatilis TaxID=10195 RepID=A0A3M7SRR9_BRAPC|nr:hypothetical protein BpHYR1_009625 [Brachionus plicatilis]